MPDRSTKCCWGRFADCEKTGGSELVRCPRDRGESVKGGTPPFTRRQRRIGTRRSARTAHQGVSIPGAERRGVRKRSHRNPAEDAPPLPDRSTKCCWGRFADCEKTGGSELVRPRDRGASVKGGTPPFTRRQRRIGTRRSARTAHQGVSIPGAERRGVRKGGRASQPDHAPTVIPLRMRPPFRTARSAQEQRDQHRQEREQEAPDQTQMLVYRVESRVHRIESRPPSRAWPPADRRPS